MGKPDALTCRSGDEKSGVEEKMFKEGQLHLTEAEGVPDVQLDGIDCAAWKRDGDGLLKVLGEHKKEVLIQWHGSKVACKSDHHARQIKLISMPTSTRPWEEIAMDFIALYWHTQTGLPKHITSDRGSQFASAFWKEINLKLDIRLRLSTAYHPQTDGLSERAIQTLKQYLRIFCHDRQNRWAA